MDDRGAIEKVLFDQRDAWNRGDLEGFMKGYAQDDALVFTSGGQVRRGFDETLAKYRAKYGADRSTMGKLQFEILSVQMVGPGGAVVMGRWELTETVQAGAGIFSVVLERRNSGWRIVFDHTSVFDS